MKSLTSMFVSARKFVAIRKLVAAAVATVALGFVAAPAHAGLTNLRSTPHATEQSQAQILSHLYGGSFTAAGNHFTNGGITATRIDDTSDAKWFGTQMHLTPVASFAGSSQTLGLVYNTGGGYDNLFTVSQFGYLPASTTTVNVGGQPFNFALDNGATNLRSLSQPGTGSADQLITYRIDGLGSSRYIMFWEDVPAGISDEDYNDLVVEAKFSGVGGPQAVPLPPAAAMGLLVMAGIGLARRWRSRRAPQVA